MISIQPTEVTHYEVKESFKFSFQPRFPLPSHRTMVGGLLQKVSATEIPHFRAPDFWKSASILPRKEFHKYYLGYFCLIHGRFSSSPALFKGISPGTVTALCGRDPQPKKLQAVNPPHCHIFWPDHISSITQVQQAPVTMVFRRKMYIVSTTHCLTAHRKLRNCWCISRILRYLKANSTVYWINDALGSYHSKDMFPKKIKQKVSDKLLW